MTSQVEINYNILYLQDEIFADDNCKMSES